MNLFFNLIDLILRAFKVRYQQYTTKSRYKNITQSAFFLHINFWGNGKTKNDVPTDIFSQGHENPLARGQENPLEIFSQRREKPAESQPFYLFRQANKKVFATRKGF